MIKALVGYTGFVGSNIMTEFSYLYNSQNIKSAYNVCPELLVYSGVPAAMFIANSNPEKDFNIILEAIENIKNIKANRMVLISTVAVYDRTNDVDETHIIDENELLPYGKNRLYLEKWVLENCKNSLVVRLPAIYGINLKKNFIYDIINVIPKMLNQSKYEELASLNSLVANNYILNKDGFYHCVAENNKELFDYFNNNDFNAIRFTDSRSIYQFYNLNNLWRDINCAIKNDLHLLNIVTEPVSAAEVYNFLYGKNFHNHLSKEPFNYNIKSCYSELFGGKNGYMLDKYSVLADVKKYVDKEKNLKWG